MNSDNIKLYQCKICKAHATGFHFDAQSCSACAAFFRRSVALKKVYKCQLGSNKCEITYAERNPCRSCRFTKCVNVGMKIDAVQPKKPSKSRDYVTTSGLKRNKRFATAATLEDTSYKTSPPHGSTESVPSVSETASPVSEEERTQSAMSFSASDCFSPRSNLEMINGLHRPKTILKCLIEEEMRITERRRIMFCERPVWQLLGANKSCPYTKDDIKPLKFRSFRKSIRTHILLIYEWLRAWPDYSILQMEDQVTLLRKCVLYHTVFDPCFITMQIGDMTKFIMQNGGYVSTQIGCDEGWENEKEISKESKKMIYWPLLERLMPEVVAPMVAMKLSFEEVVALKALVSLQGSLSDISAAGRPILRKNIDSICQSLFDFVSPEYDKAERLGNIILLLSPVFGIGDNFVEQHHFMHFFDLWQLDSLILQLLKKQSLTI